MALLVFEAIVLKSYETGNTSEVVHVFSGRAGALSVYARGLRRAKSPYRGMLQPLSRVQLAVYLKEDAEMGTLKEASLLDDNAALTHDFERLTLGLVLAEAASAAGEKNHPAEETYGALVEALRLLDPRSGMTALVAACEGLLCLLAAAGYSPGIDPGLLQPWPPGKARPVCFWLDAETATVHGRRSQPPRAPHWPLNIAANARDIPIPPAAVRMIYESPRAETTTLNAPEAAQLLQALIRVFEYHHDRPLQAAAFWRKTVGGGVT